MAEHVEDEKVAELAGSISHTSLRNKHKAEEKADIEDTAQALAQSETDDVEAQAPSIKQEDGAHDPDLVTWDGPNDPENPKVSPRSGEWSPVVQL